MPKPRGPHHPFFHTLTKRPRVIAHRGGACEWPGETIYAFEQAVNLGVDILEMDIRYTSDDDLVLMHNANVKETTGLDKKVKEMTSAEVQALDAAHWWRVRGKTFPPGAKLNVPRLEDVLAAFSDQHLVIEIKPWDFAAKHVKELGRLIEKFGMEQRVLIASGWDLPLEIFRRACPDVATSASVVEMVLFRYFSWLGYRPNADAIQTISRLWKFERINKGFVTRAHNRELVVDGWTVNHAEEMGRLIDCDIDGIITDAPTTLMDIRQ
jgi:glycerophosphoryl diester phosphodiesterase